MNEATRRQILVGAALVTSASLFSVGRAHADQPHMDAALDALKAARRELDAATADKGGHRGKALELVKEAILEVEKGIEWAKKR